MAERLGNRAGNQKVAGSITQPCKMVLCVQQHHCCFANDARPSPYLPLGNVPVITVSRSG